MTIDTRSDNRPLVLGVEIGGTKLQLALGLPGEEPILTHRGHADPERSAAGILEWFEREVDPFLSNAPGGRDTVR